MSFNLIYQQTQRWGKTLAQMAGSGPGFLAENIITPYIHIMVYHVPTMIRYAASAFVIGNEYSPCLRCRIHCA